MEVHGLSHVGRVRENNEDVFAHDARAGLAVLADGMGGTIAGEVAARLAVDRVMACLAEHGDHVSPDHLVRAVVEANIAVFEQAESRPELYGMGTTIVVVKVTGSRGWVAHVGDSRAYRLSRGELMQITEDHSLVQQMVAEGLLTRAEAFFAPNKNVITRAIGAERDVQVDVGEFNLDDGDLLMLCSDGLSDLVTDDAIGRLLADHQGDLPRTADALVDSAISAGGTDNVTVVLVEP